MTLTASEVHQLKQAPTHEGVLPTVLSRWSSRSFSPREVTDSDLEKIFEAVRWTASSMNEQPWRFLVGRQGTETHQKILAALIGWNQTWAAAAPVLVLGYAATRFAHKNRENSFAFFDLGAATFTLTLQAAALGMTTHQMAGYDQDAARAAFAIPEDFVLGTAVALGYQDEPSALTHEELLKLETAPRTRKPLAEFVFSSVGEAAKP